MAPQTEILYKAMKISLIIETILLSEREANQMKQIRRSKGVKATLVNRAVAMAAMSSSQDDAKISIEAYHVEGTM